MEYKDCEHCRGKGYSKRSFINQHFSYEDCEKCDGTGQYLYNPSKGQKGEKGQVGQVGKRVTKVRKIIPEDRLD